MFNNPCRGLESQLIHKHSMWLSSIVESAACRAVVFSRSRRQLAALDKESQYGFSADVGEEPPDLDPALSYYQLDDGADAVFTPLLVRTRIIKTSRVVGLAGPFSKTSGFIGAS